MLRWCTIALTICLTACAATVPPKAPTGLLPLDFTGRRLHEVTILQQPDGQEVTVSGIEVPFYVENESRYFLRSEVRPPDGTVEHFLHVQALSRSPWHEVFVVRTPEGPLGAATRLQENQVSCDPWYIRCLQFEVFEVALPDALLRQHQSEVVPFTFSIPDGRKPIVYLFPFQTQQQLAAVDRYRTPQ